MKTVYSTLGFALGASAAALAPRAQCCFSLTAAGGKSGVVGQLSDGQNRIGQTAGLATGQATYCLNNGGLTDENGRGCILTPPTTQLQCDVGASPTTGFAVNSNGDLTYNGNTQFYACATGDNGGYNIYYTTSSAESGCVKITLNTGGKCAASGSGSSSAASSKPASSAPASSKPASSAPASSKPASSAPASSAPAPSKPASSAPAPSAPASSAPAPSKPASSAPPASQPASPVPASSAPPAANTPTTVYMTSTVTVTDCSRCTNGAGMPSAPASKPASSAPAPSAPASSAPAPSKPASSAPAPSAPASSAPASKPASSAPASGTVASNVCATTLTGAYQTPHAIIPVNKNSPSTSYGTQYDAYLSSSNSTVFNFDIPSSYAGKQCTVIFLLPNKSQLVTSDFTMSGSGGIKFDQLTSPAPLSVSYATCPAVKSELGMVNNVTPGNSYVVSSGACQAGSTISILASATGSLNLEYFQDWNPSAIGLYITSC